MARSAQRLKTGAGRAKAAPSQPAREPEGDRLDAIFAALPEPRAASGGVPDVVRKNRRGRAKLRLREALESRGPYPVPEARWSEVRVLAERWARKDFEDAFAEVMELEIRCAEERVVLDAEARGDEEGRFAAAERAYRRAVIERYGRIEIRGLQLSARVHQDLEIAYVPLHVTEIPEVKDSQDDVLWLGFERTPAIQALAKHPRLFLIGGPGSGKSTLVAYLAARAAGGELKDAPIPFVVPVRALRQAPETIEDLAKAAGAEPWLMERALRGGEALLLIDGIDEARAEVSGALLPALGRMLSELPSARVMITTRPVGGSGRDTVAPPGFARMQLISMTRDEVDVFIDKWCLAAELSISASRETAEAKAKAAAEDLKGRVHTRRAIEKIAQTPLMCSVICVVHRFLGQQIPDRRVVLYETITNVLLHEWDRAKFPDDAAIGKLDAAAKKSLLSKLARAMHDDEVAELPEAEVVQRFAAQLPDLGQPAENARAMVEEIRDRSGVLVERAPGTFAFSHLTLQEFLTALDLVKSRAYDQLVNLYQDSWWHETIVLAAGFPNADTAAIIRGLLDKDGQEVGKGTMLAAQCVETAVDLPASLRKEIEARVAQLIPPKDLGDSMRLIELGDVVAPLVLRDLERVAPPQRGRMLYVLGRLEYEPAIGAICKHMTDSRETNPFILKMSRNGRTYTFKTLAEHAAYAAIKMLKSPSQDLVLRALLEAIPRADPSAIHLLIFVRRYGNYDWSAHDKIDALFQRYNEAHPKRASSKRAARSG